MMIYEGVLEIERLAQRVVDLRETQQHGQALTRRHQSIAAMLERGLRARAASQLLSTRVDPDAPVQLPASASAARASLDAWGASLEDDLASALGGDSFAQLSEIVLRAVADLESQSTQLWQRYTSHHAPQTSVEIVEALANDPASRVAVLRIRRLSDQLTGLRSRPVPSTGDIDDFDRAARELREAWAALDVEGIDPEVISFLRAANSDEGAAIGSLTPVVIRWLEERGAVSQYVVKPAD